MAITQVIKEFIERARVARLATVDYTSKPHLVPVVFVFDGNHFFIPIDQKRSEICIIIKPEKVASWGAVPDFK